MLPLLCSTFSLPCGSLKEVKPGTPISIWPLAQLAEDLLEFREWTEAHKVLRIVPGTKSTLNKWKLLSFTFRLALPLHFSLGKVSMPSPMAAS